MHFTGTYALSLFSLTCCPSPRTLSPLTLLIVLGLLFKQVTRIDSQNLQNNLQHTHQAANEAQVEANTQRDQPEAAIANTTATAAQPEGASRGTQGGAHATTATNANTTNTGNSNNANSDNKVPVTDGLQIAPLPIENHPSLADKQGKGLLLSLFLNTFAPLVLVLREKQVARLFIFIFGRSSRFER